MDKPQRGSDIFADSLLNRVSMGTLCLDGETVVDANQAAASMLGRSIDELRGRTFSDLSSCSNPDQLHPRDILLEHVGSQVPSQSLLWSFKLPDGGDFDAEVHLSPVRHDGRSYALALMRDVPERREFENRILEAHRMGLLGQLTAGVAHDFNNLLTAIQGHLDLMIETAGNEDAMQSHLEIARTCSHRAAALSRRLLDFSRAQLSSPEEKSLDRIVSETVSFLRPLIRADVELKVEADDEVHPVWVDVGQIERVLMNLTLNAEAALSEGGRITYSVTNHFVDEAFVRRYPWVSPGFYAKLEVRDDGPGIPEEVRRRIFHPFYTTEQRKGSTGLGLSIVYTVAKQHRGFVDVDCPPEGGTVFWLLLPAAAGTAEVESLNPTGKRQEADRRAPTILVVEDEDVVREITMNALDSRGFRLMPASSAEEAEKLYEDRFGEVDLVLTDVMLSGLDGCQLVTRLRKRRPSVKVIYTSGYGVEQLPTRPVLDDSTLFLEKPYTMKELATTIRGLLGAAR